MKAIDQRTDSDCLRCCVAMVLGLDYDDVPDFTSDELRRQTEVLVEWANARGLDIVYLQATSDGELLSVGGSSRWIAAGDTERGTRHAVVCQGAELAHDPHASSVGLLSIDSAIVFVPASNPAPVGWPVGQSVPQPPAP